MKRLLCIIALFIPLLLGASLGQELIGADSLSVGTAFDFVIHADKAISAVELPDSLENFAILSSKAVNRQAASWQIRLAPLKTGAQSFPRLRVILKLNSAEAESTDAFRVSVLATRAESDTLLRDIKPMQRYPLQPAFWIYLLCILLVIVLGLYLLFHHIKKRRKAKAKQKQLKPIAEAAKAIPIEKPWQIALRELAALCAENLLDQDELVQYYFRLSEILRRFLESSYGFPALEMTQSEISVLLRQRNIAKSQELNRFLLHCDLAKFAKAKPERQQTESYTEWLRSYFGSFSVAASQSPKSASGVPDA